MTEFSFQRESNLAQQQNAEENRRTGFLAHELRKALGTATNSLRALELSSMPVSGATGAVLKRSLTAMSNLIARALDEVRSGAPDEREAFSVAALIADARSGVQLQANSAAIALDVQTLDPTLYVRGNRELLLAALTNLLIARQSIEPTPGP